MYGTAAITHGFTVVRPKDILLTIHIFDEVQVMDVRVYKNTGCHYYKTLFTFDHTGRIPFLIKIFINTYCATFSRKFFIYKATRGQHQRRRHQWT